MNKQEKRKHRKALTWSVIMYIFAIMFISVILSFAGVLVLLSMDILPGIKESGAGPKDALVFMLVINLIVGLLIISITSRISLKYINTFINQMNRLASGDFKARLNVGSVAMHHPTINEITNCVDCRIYKAFETGKSDRRTAAGVSGYYRRRVFASFSDGDKCAEYDKGRKSDNFDRYNKIQFV